MVFGTEVMDLKSREIGNLRPEGRLDAMPSRVCGSGRGFGVCKFYNVSLTRFVAGRGDGFNRFAHSAGPLL